MEIRFVKLSPTQNMTILVESPVSPADRSRIARALMDYSNVYSEQVGFLSAPKDDHARMRMDMMGGEFCGNGSMACACYCAYLDSLPDGDERIIPLEVSGYEGILTCLVKRRGNAYYGNISMPLPEKICTITFSNGITCPVVFFPGIAHAILEDNGEDDTPVIAQMCTEIGAEAFGMIRQDKSGNIRPLVYVASTGSVVYERGCGSGTAAVIAYTAYVRKADAESDILQPGGMIHARAEITNGRLSLITINGKVTIAAIGTAFVEPEG